VSAVANMVIAGAGVLGYQLAVRYVADEVLTGKGCRP